MRGPVEGYGRDGFDLASQQLIVELNSAPPLHVVYRQKKPLLDSAYNINGSG